MIYTVTPNPALDLGGVVDEIAPNEKNYIRGESRYPGGNAINVARFLTRLGVPVVASGFLGGSIGGEIRNLLDEEGVAQDFVLIAGHTRISITVSNLSNHQQTRFSFPGPKIRPHEFEVLERRVSSLKPEGLLVIGGSFPPGFSVFHLNRLIRSAQRRKVSVIIDIPGHLFKETHLKNVMFIKPNLSELEDHAGRKISSVPLIVNAARKLARDVRLVCISSVDGGALLVSGKSAWFGQPPRIKWKTTVGAGDSMVAAIAGELHQHKASAEGFDVEPLMPELLKHGLAAAAATLSVPGTALGNPGDMRRFLGRVSVRRLKL